MKDWEQYEQQIYDKYKSSFTDCTIKKNTKIMGRYSQVPRQIDVLLNGNIADQNIDIIIECKYFNTKVDVKIVDGFIGFLEDVDVTHGTLITNKGFSKGAYNRASFACNKKIKLDIVDFREFDKYIFEPYTNTKCHICDDPYRNIVFWDRHDVCGKFDVGHCAYCNETHIRCQNCGAITSITEAENNGIIECDGGCGLKIKYSHDECNGEYFEIIKKGKIFKC